MVLSLTLLGDFAIRDEMGKAMSLPTRKTQALLAYLAVNADRPQRRDRLMALLWSDRGEQQARHSLNQALMSIRRLGSAAGVTLLDGDGERVTLLGDALAIDVAAFRNQLLNDPAAAAALYDGPFLDGLKIPDPAFEEWLAATRAELHNLACSTFERGADAAAELSDIPRAIEFAQRLLRLDPLREDGHRRLMLYLSVFGDRTAAVRQYQACAQLLRSELGVEPSAETVALVKEIKSQAGPSEPYISTMPPPDLPNDAPILRPNRPSIAVLPFDNLSNDPEQEFLADGMAEDIIAGLSKFRWLVVIARGSTFTYKRQSKGVRAIAQELGARYVLEGSIRRSGNRIRVAAQLVDAKVGAQIWSERFDRKLEEIFDIQDDVANSIIAAIAPEISQAEIMRLRRRPPDSVDAWGLYQQALALYPSGDKVDFETAIELFDRAYQADPHFVDAMAMASLMRLRKVYFFGSKANSEIIKKARNLLQKAMRLDQRNSTCLSAMGRLHQLSGEYDLAALKCHEALILNPNSVLSHVEMAIAMSGLKRWEEAIEHWDVVRRLSPRDPHTAATFAGRAHNLFQLERYEESVESARLASQSPNPRFWADVILVAALTVLGRTAEANAAKRTLLERKPDFAISQLTEIQALKSENIHNALRKAGFSD